MMRHELARRSQLELASIFAELQVCTGRCAVEGCVGANHGGSWKGLAKVELSQLGGLICYRSVKVSCLLTATPGPKIHMTTNDAIRTDLRIRNVRKRTRPSSRS